VGGCATGLLITDAAGAEVRPTFDVDVIAEITSYAGYEAFSERLRSRGFEEDVSEGAPQCRWLVDGMKLDVMPLDEKILAFTNRWYRGALTEAKGIEVELKLRIRVITAPYFIAAKLEAFNGLIHSGAVGNGAVVLHHGGVASLERFDDVLGQLLRAKGRIRCCAGSTTQSQAAVVQSR